MSKYMDLFESWLQEPELEETLREELARLKEQGDAGRIEIEDRFYRDLEFGTGGLRGILGAGTNRMNVHTVAKAAQGVADYVTEGALQRAEKGEYAKPSFAVSYDSRINSQLFAKVCTEVLLNNGVDVFLFEELMPTPALSFVTRFYGCQGGMMITASHNPSKYNGLKVYNKDGCQETLEAAEQIMNKIEALDTFRGIRKTPQPGMEKGFLTMIPSETAEAYIDAVNQQALDVDCQPEKLKVVFTPLNGAGNKPVRRILEKIGVTHIHVVPEQENPDGNFPTCPYPNPEKEEALALAKKLYMDLYDKAEREEDKPDILLATDPDSDRIGVACYRDGKVETITGNDIGVLLLDFICNYKTLPEKPIAIRTIVSTKMVDELAKKHGVQMITTLTGFKFIGEQIGYLEEREEADRFVFGFEESVGYLSGSHVRDKDAINAAMLICQMAGLYKKLGKTLFDRLEELYQEFGYWQNDLLEFAFEGAKGMEIMSQIMSHFRTSFFGEFAGKSIYEIVDYKRQTRRVLKTEVCCSMVSGTRPTNLPSSDVMEFVLEGNASFALRPSGTEPKFKIYMGAKGATKEDALDFLKNLRQVLSDIIVQVSKE